MNICIPLQCRGCDTELKQDGHGFYCPNRLCEVIRPPKPFYTPDQERVVEYILELTNDEIGAGDDPIGFILASHAHLREQLRSAVKMNNQLKMMVEFPGCGGCPIKLSRDG